MNLQLKHYPDLPFTAVVSLLLFTLAATTLPAVSWSEATQLQQAENYEQAAAQYQTLFESDHRSPALAYNQAYCAYQLADYGMARYYIELALRQKKNWLAARQLRQAIFEELDDPDSPTPTPPWRDIWYTLSYLLPVNVWSVLGLLCCLSAGAIGWVAIRQKKRRWWTVAALLAGLAVMWLILAMTRYQQMHRENEVVVTQEKVALRLSPTTDSPQSQILKLGGVYMIQARLDGWYKLELANGTIGWVDAKLVKRL